MATKENVRDYFNPPFAVINKDWARSKRRTKLIDTIRVIRKVEVDENNKVTGIYVTDKDVFVPSGSFEQVSTEPWKTANRFVLPKNFASMLKSWDRGQGNFYSLEIAAHLAALDLGVTAFLMKDDFTENGVQRDVDISSCGLDLKVPYFLLFPIYDPSLKKVSLDSLKNKIKKFLEQANKTMGLEIVAYTQDMYIITKETFQDKEGFTLRQIKGTENIANLSKVMQFQTLEDAQAKLKNKSWEY